MIWDKIWVRSWDTQSLTISDKGWTNSCDSVDDPSIHLPWLVISVSLKMFSAVSSKSSLIHILFCSIWKLPVFVYEKISQGSGQSRHTNCSRCGKSSSHSIEVCPAKDAICRKCRKKGHFQWACRSNKKISSVNKSPEQPDKSFFFRVVSYSKEPWSVTVRLNGRSTNLCLDTGYRSRLYRRRLMPRLAVLNWKGSSSDQFACKDASWDTCKSVMYQGGNRYDQESA